MARDHKRTVQIEGLAPMHGRTWRVRVTDQGIYLAPTGRRASWRFLPWDEAFYGSSPSNPPAGVRGDTGRTSRG